MFNKKVSLQERCTRIKSNIDSTITKERRVGVLVGVGVWTKKNKNNT